MTLHPSPPWTLPINDSEILSPRDNASRRVLSYMLALALHVVVLVLLSFNLDWTNSQANVGTVYVEVWDRSALQNTPSAQRATQEKIKRQLEEAASRAEEESRREAQEEAQRQAQQEALEKTQRQAQEDAKRQAQDEAIRLETQRKVQAEIQRQEEAKRKAEAEAKRKAQAAAERKAKAEAKRKAKVEAKRKAQQAEAKRKAKEARELRDLQEQIRRKQEARNDAAVAAPNGGGEQGLSESYQGKVRARVRPNIVYSGSKAGNPSVEVEVQTNADGLIIKSIIRKSSNRPEWDKAVLQALRKTVRLPKDRNGRVPTPLLLRFSPND